jgi:signal transduction histidine kinase
MMRMDSEPSAPADHLVATLADIAAVLESPRDLSVRVARALELLGKLVPYCRCAVLKRGADEHTVIAVPVGSDNVALQAYLTASLLFLEGKGARPAPLKDGARLALPIIGLEQIIGVLVVEHPRADAYEPRHLRLLSAVSSQLGSYLTLARLHEESAQHANVLRERSDQLRDAARFREEFIGIVGHDLRDPLSAISMAAQLLQEQDASKEQRDALAARILRSSVRMTRMIDELLDFTRGRLGSGLPVSKAPVDLAEVARQVVDELRGTKPDACIDLRTSGDTTGVWDADRLARMLSNLISNALRYRTPNTPVRVDVCGGARETSMAIHNHGEPIADEEIATIFEPFRRASSAHAKSSEGLGLGLYIARSIAQAHAGSVKVRSSREDGTTFTVCLPSGL